MTKESVYSKASKIWLGPCLTQESVLSLCAACSTKIPLPPNSTLQNGTVMQTCAPALERVPMQNHKTLFASLMGGFGFLCVCLPVCVCLPDGRLRFEVICLVRCVLPRSSWLPRSLPRSLWLLLRSLLRSLFRLLLRSFPRSLWFSLSCFVVLCCDVQSFSTLVWL